MNYQLKEVAPEVFILLCESRPCNCPFRTSFPTEQPQMLSGKPPQVAFVNQNCGSQCPLFEMKEEALQNTVIDILAGQDPERTNEVILHCGSKRILKDVEFIKIAPKA